MRHERLNGPSDGDGGATRLRTQFLGYILGFSNCHVGYILKNFYNFGFMPEGTSIRVLLVEDHSLVGEEMRSLLQSYPNIEVIGLAEDGEEAVSEVAKLQPTVVVMDVNLPKMDGIAATRVIKGTYPHIVVIGLTAATEDYLLYAMLRAGAFEVLGKANAASDLYSTIQRAVATTQPILILQEDKITPSISAPREEPTSLPKTDVLPAAGNIENIDSEDKA